MAIGFKRNQLKPRYDISNIAEDDWHTHSGKRTARIVTKYLSFPKPQSNWLLNAGAGIYRISLEPWKEIGLDLFTSPIQYQEYAICGSVEHLPFESGVFGSVVCVGEVLGYCDPAKAFSEFARVLCPTGILIFDFGNTRSIRFWFRRPYGRAADIVTGCYNNTPETTWVYDPNYVKSILGSVGFRIKATMGTHLWSCLARRLGAPMRAALSIERWSAWAQLPGWADLMTIVAVRDEGER